MRAPLGLLVLAALILCGCGGSARHDGAQPTELRLAIIPSDDGHSALSSSENMKNALEAAIGIKIKLIKAADYSGVIEACKTKKAELGFFGPLSYVLAHREAKVELVAAYVGRTGNGTYHSIITVAANSPFKSWSDLKGKKIALVDPASTSGSLMPHLMVKRATGDDLEQYFSKVIYCGSHPATLKALVNRTVDVAAVEERLAEAMVKAGQIPAGSVRELFRSSELPPSPLAMRSDLDPELKRRIKSAAISIKQIPGPASNSGPRHFRRVDHSEYLVVEQMLDELKLQRDKVLSK